MEQTPRSDPLVPEGGEPSLTAAYFAPPVCGWFSRPGWATSEADVLAFRANSELTTGNPPYSIPPYSTAAGHQHQFESEQRRGDCRAGEVASHGDGEPSSMNKGFTHEGRYSPSRILRLGNGQEDEAVESTSYLDKRRVYTGGAHAGRDVAGVIE